MFPGWHVETQEGPASVGLTTSKAGRVLVTVPEPGRYRLRVSFGTSPVRAMFGGLSLLAVLAAWPLFRFIARKPAEVALVQEPAEAEPSTRLAA
jgi:hypothetical protein